MHRHIRRCAACKLLLAELCDAAGEHELQGKAELESEPGPGPGDSVGRFVLERLLGVGGMGAVWAARDPSLGRFVALKLVRSRSWNGGDSSQHHQRLLQEAKAMANLAHPNVVPVFEVGEAGAQVFVVMELVEGETLAKWPSPGPIRRRRSSRRSSPREPGWRQPMLPGLSIATSSRTTC